MTPYPHLFSPLEIRGVRLENRIVFPPMNTGYPSTEGLVTERLRDYLLARARGGAGLIIVEATYVDPGGRNSPVEMGLDDDRGVEGLAGLAEAVHGAGSRLLVQLTHHGRMAPSMFTERAPVGPSAEPASWRAAAPSGLPYRPHDTARPLAREEIASLVERFGEAARRARRAGLDGVEIHGAHGYLLSSFLSPLTNRRTDEYGGSLEGRARFALEVVRRVRAEVGERMIVGFRINGADNVEGGQTISDAVAYAHLLVEAGVDVLHVSASFYGAHPPIMPPMQEPHACFAPLARAIKGAVPVPVIGGGRVVAPEDAEGVLARGDADLVFMGRALLADPDLPREAREGRSGDINLCNGCCQCIEFGEEQAFEIGIHCLVNPRLGREGTVEITPAATPRRVAVVGGGPSGLMAAMVAATRGHEVTLFEAAGELGGRLLREARVPGKAEARVPADRWAERLRRLGTRIHLGHRASPADLAGRFDAAVIAVGSEAFVPEPLARSGLPCVTSDDVLDRAPEVGGHAVVLGDGIEALDVGIVLADRGIPVSVLESPSLDGPAPPGLADLAEAVGIPINRPYALVALAARGGRAWRRPRVLALGPAGVTVRDESEETVEIPPPVTLVSAYRRPRPFDVSALAPCEAVIVGDARRPARSVVATREGFDAALRL